jgi:hypothetical protein
MSCNRTTGCYPLRTAPDTPKPVANHLLDCHLQSFAAAVVKLLGETPLIYLTIHERCITNAPKALIKHYTPGLLHTNYPTHPSSTTYNFNQFVRHYFYSQINYLGFGAALSEAHNLR